MKRLMLGLMMAFAATANAEIVKEYTLSDSLTATLDDQGVLTIIGSGAMPNWTGSSERVWDNDVSKIKSVVAEGVTSVADVAFKGCSSLTSVSLPKVICIGKDAFMHCDDLSTLFVNGLMKSVIETIGMATFGLFGDVEITDSGAQGDYKFVPEDSVVVTKESIAAAKAMTVQVVNGQVELGVSVCSNADITASTANWAPVKFTKDTQIGLSADGTKLILPIPVAAQQGFMILQSGDAKVQSDELKLSGGKVFTGDY